MATIKQKLAVNNIAENGGNVGKAMLDAGYTKISSLTPKKLTDSKGYKEESKSVVALMKRARRKAIARMAQTVGTANYSDVARGADLLTKNIQLLSGKETENIKVVQKLNDDEQSKISNALESL